MKRIYADYAATTPLHPKALAQLHAVQAEFGNPSSLHADGRKAKNLIDQAREIMSQRLGCLFAEVLFTASGTESANLAIVGTALANTDPSRNRILLCAAEHLCVLHTSSLLVRLGYQVELIDVNRVSQVNLGHLTELCDDSVLLVSVMHANNELGTFNDPAAVAAVAHQSGAVFHCDAVQTFLQGSWTVDSLSADLITVSAHKVGGPKGAGALYIRGGTKIWPLIAGGSQEREVRAGTENVAAISSFGAAVQAYEVGNKQVARDAFLVSVSDDFVQTVPNQLQTLPGHAHLRCPGLDAETVLIRLDRMGVSASSGAACSSGSLEPSHVLLACGYTSGESKEGLRFTFGSESTPEDARECALRLNYAVQQILHFRDV